MEGITAFVLCLLVSCACCYKLSRNRNHVGQTGGMFGGCQIHTDEMSKSVPLLLVPGTNQTVYPDNGHVITLAPDQGIELTCPGLGNVQVGSFAAAEVTLARCTSGSQFRVGQRLLEDLNDAYCMGKMRNIARSTGKRCSPTGREIEVGFEIKGGRFVRLYTSCFDQEARNVLYSRHVLTKWILEKISGSVMMPWTEDNLYNLGASLAALYRKKAGLVNINEQLGLPKGDTTYVDERDKYLSKGHLTPRADFFYPSQRLATYHYVNAVPEWKMVNERNWRILEDNVREYAAEHSVDLEVITGTYGVVTLNHTLTGKEVELYLYVGENEEKAIPVPGLMWKLIYDPENRAGVVLLVVNNPYSKDVAKSVICDDVADQLTWLTFNRFNKGHGYVYACRIPDFVSVVPYLPRFDVKNILK